MATRGTAAKSASGAAMSKYDVEVEARLKALESQAHSKCDGGGDSERIAALEAKVNDLIARLSKKMSF
jgi:hypothetical protein